MERADRYRPDEQNWRLLSSELRFSSPFLSVYQERIIPPSKEAPVDWMVVRRKFAVVVAPITQEGKYVLVRQERVPVRLALWEFPAGQVDSGITSDEALQGTLHRELREETGYQATPETVIHPLGYFFSSQGFTDEHCYLFAATSVAAVGAATPENEESILEVGTFSSEELRSMIARNEIRDANTLATYARLAAVGGFSV